MGSIRLQAVLRLPPGRQAAITGASIRVDDAARRAVRITFATKQRTARPSITFEVSRSGALRFGEWVVEEAARRCP